MADGKRTFTRDFLTNGGVPLLPEGMMTQAEEEELSRLMREAPQMVRMGAIETVQSSGEMTPRKPGYRRALMTELKGRYPFPR